MSASDKGTSRRTFDAVLQDSVWCVLKMCGRAYSLAAAMNTLLALRCGMRPDRHWQRFRGLLAPAVCVSTWLLLVNSLHACPSCATGVQARSQVWTNQFAFNLTVAILPFVIIGAICWVLESRS